MSGVRSLLGGLLWLVIIVAIALGAAGIVTGMDHPPGSAARGEVAPGDAEVTPLLDAAEADFGTMSDQVEALGTDARTALAALSGTEPSAGDAAIEHGNGQVAAIVALTAKLRRELAAVPYVGTPTAGLFVSGAIVARHGVLMAALDATDGLDVAWSRLTTSSLAATRMSSLLAAHDALVVKAADGGVHAKYADAMKLLDRARAQIAAARALRDQLVATVDVIVLDDWLSRNEAYDIALHDLYRAISKVSGRVTAATRAAVKAEAAARARLPPDTRGLVVIMAEIGRGGMNGAVIAIEEARGKLADALDAGTAAPGGDPQSSDSP